MLPTEDEQHRRYRALLESFAPKPVTIRTQDTGGGKKLPFFTITVTNPFLGRRGIRFTLDHTEFFLTQLRALMRANAGLGNLHPAGVHVVGDIVQRAHRQNKPVGASCNTHLT
jgi:phosphotransferase system enzyme I (PtsP)